MYCVITVCRLLALHLRFKIFYLFLKFSSLQYLKFYLVSKSKSKTIPSTSKLQLKLIKVNLGFETLIKIAIATYVAKLYFELKCLDFTHPKNPYWIKRIQPANLSSRITSIRSRTGKSLLTPRTSCPRD